MYYKNKINGILSLNHAINYLKGMNFIWDKIIINKRIIYNNDIIFDVISPGGISSKKKENGIFYREGKKVAELKNEILKWS